MAVDAVRFAPSFILVAARSAANSNRWAFRRRQYVAAIRFVCLTVFTVSAGFGWSTVAYAGYANARAWPVGAWFGRRLFAGAGPRIGRDDRRRRLVSRRWCVVARDFSSRWCKHFGRDSVSGLRSTESDGSACWYGRGFVCASGSRLVVVAPLPFANGAHSGV